MNSEIRRSIKRAKSGNAVSVTRLSGNYRKIVSEISRDGVPAIRTRDSNVNKKIRSLL